MRVIALELGYDNVALREVGTEFEMPDDVFDRRPRLDASGAVIPNAFYDPPSWFEPVDPKLKAKVDEERKAIRKLAVHVPAVDPAKQHAAYEASIKALRDEIEALKKAPPQK
jgi:ferritin-like protein